MNDLMTKSFLNYVDLKKEALKDLEAAGDDSAAAAAALEMTAVSSGDESLRRFLDEAENVREQISQIREALLRLQEANEEGKSMHRPESLRSLRARISTDIVAVLRQARAIKGRLEDMDRANLHNRRLSGCREGTPVDRSRTAVTNGLRKKLRDLMLDFQALRQRMMAEHREAVERRYYTVTGEAAGEEVIDNMLARSDGGEELLRRAVMEGHGKGEVMAAVEEMQGRRDAAKEVEKSLLELHQVFLDMAVMVEAQGEQLDNIEHHVSHAASYVKDGAKELGKASEYQKSSRKWMCIGIIVLLLIILLIIIPTVVSVSRS